MQLIGQPARAVPHNGQWKAIRVIHPGEAVTMDHSASRLNVTVDGAGKILTLICA